MGSLSDNRLQLIQSAAKEDLVVDRARSRFSNVLPKDSGWKADNYSSSFSGTDVEVSAFFSTGPESGIIQFGNVQTITSSGAGSSTPVLGLGRKAPYGYSIGDRTCAGSIVFSHIDLDPVYNMLAWLARTARAGNIQVGGSRYMHYTDLPPFTIMMVSQTEIGDGDPSEKRPGVVQVKFIWDVQLLNNGSVVSVDDMFTEHQYAYVASGDTPWLPVDESGVAGALRKLEVSKTEDQPSPFDYSGTPQLLDRTRIQDPKLKRAAMNPPPRPAYSEQEIKINELGRDIDKKMDDVMAGIDPADQAAVNARFEQLRKTMAAESGDADVSTINNRAKLQALADYVAGTISYGDLRPVSIIMKNEMQIDLMTMSRMSERRQQYITAKAKMEADQAQLQRDLDARESALATEALRKRNDELRRADPADPSNWE